MALTSTGCEPLLLLRRGLCRSDCASQSTLGAMRPPSMWPCSPLAALLKCSAGAQGL